MAEIRDELAVLENPLVKLMDRKKSKEATVPHGGSLKKESVSAASGTCEKVRPQLCRSSVSMIAKILQDKPQPAGSGSKPGPAGSTMIPDSGKSSTDQQLSPESGIHSDRNEASEGDQPRPQKEGAATPRRQRLEAGKVGRHPKRGTGQTSYSNFS